MNTYPILVVLRGRFKTEVADAKSLITQYDNKKKDPPNNAMWARFTFLPNPSEQVTVGPPKQYRTDGLVIVSLFAPLGDGDKNVMELADFIAQKFRPATLTGTGVGDGVVLRTPAVARIGRSGPSWQVNVTCPWFCDLHL